MSALTKYSLKFLELLENGDKLSRAELRLKTGCGNSSFKMTIWKLLSDECVLIKKISHFSYYSITDTGREVLQQCRVEWAQKERTKKVVKLKVKQAQAEVQVEEDPVDAADRERRRALPRTMNLFTKTEYHPNSKAYYRNDGKLNPRDLVC